ncbi:hypothetical protein NUU61_005338 [Penicillium alfredii]|uniref:Nascent polypeptide-associated complex subunit alpha-like UBA domain-containing protein n=1 Tax=Penicillium alfredii TaxID=1506179 RepID=A0A9W9F9B2_9EURO|nr:uncharacterized protein NUU61_005338 [Penicillium alfredii]KAJ5095982.1 hypothetical protein NUU61_005338 [Penicillium alfredii]
MSDPIPPAFADPDTVDQSLPANAEDRKAAAALSSLNTTELGTDASAKPPPSADQEALGKAMSRLEIATGHDTGRKQAADAQNKDAEVVKEKAVKVAAADVTLLVDQLDMNKNKATELLKAHDGDATKAMRAFVTPSVQV